MTLGDLRKAMEWLPDETPVLIALGRPCYQAAAAERQTLVFRNGRHFPRAGGQGVRSFVIRCERSNQPAPSTTTPYDQKGDR